MNQNAGLSDSGKLRSFGVVALLLLIIFLFHSFTLREGHGWGDDFAMYVHHAENIAQHRPYADTGYIYNQREAYYGPRSYPPIFPLLLAPVISSVGMDFTAMKMVEVATFSLSLLVIYFLFCEELALPYMAALLIILGFNPTLWEMKDSLTSDYPFWLFFLLACLIIDKAPRTGNAAVLWGLLAGVTIYLGYGTRSIGLVALLGLLLYEVIKYRKITLFLAASGGMAVMLAVMQRIILGGSEASYADQFHVSVHSVIQNVRDYASVLAFFWPWSFGRIPAYLLFAIFTALAAAGAYRTIRRRGLRSFDVILPLYCMVIVVWPGNQGMRFLLPAVPVYFAYALMSLSELTVVRGPVFRWAALAVLLCAAGGLYAKEYRAREFVRIRETSGRPTFMDLCRFVRYNSNKSDVFIFYRARALSLFTDRPASVYDLDGTPAIYDEQWREFGKVGVKYIVYSRLFPPDKEFLKPLLDRHSTALKPVYHNSDFTVYQMKDNAK